jgi:hypothetical protein
VEVNPLNEDIRCGKKSLISHLHYGNIVTDAPDEILAGGGHPASDALDEPEFSDVANIHSFHVTLQSKVSK